MSTIDGQETVQALPALPRLRRPIRLTAFKSSYELGSFSPISFTLKLAGNAPSHIGALSPEDKVTLDHEFGHLLQYFTSYIGLTDLRHWVRAISIIESSRPDGVSPEQHVTSQSRALIDLERVRQVLRLDEFYYWERNDDLWADAGRETKAWHCRDVTGSLFDVRGNLSDRRFWSLRFYLHGDLSLSFARVPVGIKAILEHVAIANDMFGEFACRSQDDFLRYMTELSEQAYVPDLLHYFALTHRLSGLIMRSYGAVATMLTFAVTGQLVLLLAEIPFDEPVVWQRLRAYAAKTGSDLFPHMNHPHPSFVFPLLVRALERRRPPIEQLIAPEGFYETSAQLLQELGLPTLLHLRAHRDSLRESILTMLAPCDPTGNRSRLIRWLADYDARLGANDRIRNPSKNLDGSCPVPIYFDDSAVDGTIFSLEDAQILERRYVRLADMIMYPVWRDIVP